MDHPVTPDGRYFLVRGRLWRRTDPALDPVTRQRLTNELMSARRDWWDTGEPDLTRHLAKNTGYADWLATL